MKFFVNKKLEKNNSIFEKKSKITLAKSTTALTCLITSLFVNSETGLAQTTTTGSMVVSTSVASTCTVNAGAMTFAAYAGSEITATSAITANCTNGTAFTISFSTAADTGSIYYLVRDGGSSSTLSDRLETTFKNGSAQTMTAGGATITGTGSGSSAAAGTITGTIAASQTGKTAGSYSKTITLNLVY